MVVHPRGVDVEATADVLPLHVHGAVAPLGVRRTAHEQAGGVLGAGGLDDVPPPVVAERRCRPRGRTRRLRRRGRTPPRRTRGRRGRRPSGRTAWPRDPPVIGPRTEAPVIAGTLPSGRSHAPAATGLRRRSPALHPDYHSPWLMDSRRVFRYRLARMTTTVASDIAPASGGAGHDSDAPRARPAGLGAALAAGQWRADRAREPRRPERRRPLDRVQRCSASSRSAPRSSGSAATAR